MKIENTQICSANQESSENLIKPDYYQFEIKGQTCDVNDILQALSKKLKGRCSLMQFNFLSNSIEYIMRSFLKGNTTQDIEKARTELKFLLEAINEEEVF